MARTLVTTTDNPFDPFKQFEQWKSFDEVVCGYYTLNYLARIAATSPELTGKEMDQAIEDACDEVCEMDLRYISPVTNEEVCYFKVTEDDED